MKIDREAVRWAYRLFLGREPDNEKILDELASQARSYAELKNTFLNCDEYRQNNPGLLTGFEPPLQIEAMLSAQDQQLLFDHVQATWEKLGEEEPHWSVLTWEKFRQANIDNFTAEFFASGAPDVERMICTLQRCGVPLPDLRTCLEFGCGLGRVTCWLEKRFEQVIAVDISKPHLAGAAEHIKSEKVTFLHLASLADMKSLPKVDLLFSVIVLQHNPPPVIMALLGDLLTALNPGGVAYFQVPTYVNGYSFSLEKYRQQTVGNTAMEMHLLPQRLVFEIIAANGCRVLEVLQDDMAFGLSNTFVVQKT